MITNKIENWNLPERLWQAHSKTGDAFNGISKQNFVRKYKIVRQELNPVDVEQHQNNSSSTSSSKRKIYYMSNYEYFPNYYFKNNL